VKESLRFASCIQNGNRFVSSRGAIPVSEAIADDSQLFPEPGAASEE
jgi:hypothetical protein